MIDLSSDRNRFATTAMNQNGKEVSFFLYYRRPTNEEVIAYNRSLFIKKNGKPVNQVVPTRIEFALRILTGVQDGIFSLNGKPVSSDPSSPDFNAAWKEILKNAFATNLVNFAFRVFESVSNVEIDPEELAATEEGEENLPLVQS